MFKKIALATALIATTASVSLATEFDPNLTNRYPQAASKMFEGRNVALTGTQNVIVRSQDRASNPAAGGGY